MEKCKYCSRPNRNKSVYHIGDCPYIVRHGLYDFIPLATDNANMNWNITNEFLEKIFSAQYNTPVVIGKKG